MKKPKALKTVFLAIGMAMLCGCSAKSGSAEAFSPIYISKDDQITDATARQILQHNELGRELHIW
jgi:uncharacterized lipoprotein YajG